MSRKDIFEEAFDEGTITKLEIFEEYLKEWLPTFIMRRDNLPIQIYDLFAGQGYDENSIAGSPIRILEIIKKFENNLYQQRKKVNLYLNELHKKKYKSLQKNVEEKISELSLDSIVNLKITNDDFKNCISTYKSDFKKGGNLVFLDQNGFKEINEAVFNFLINLNKTDFLFFISSTHIHRFAETKEFRNIHPKFDVDKIVNCSRNNVHNIINEEYHKYIPSSVTDFHLIPFSIMKNDHNNVYGLIFFCKHALAADKFLKTLWKQNPINGNANFDIDEDKTKNQLDLFLGKKLTKIETFHKLLKEKILSYEIKNNKEAYLFTLNKGHIDKHAYDCIKQLKDQNIIHYEGKTPLTNYEQIFKNKKIINFEVK